VFLNNHETVYFHFSPCFYELRGHNASINYNRRPRHLKKAGKEDPILLYDADPPWETTPGAEF